MLKCLTRKSDPVSKAQSYKLRNRKYREENIIAEGGYAYIWKCENFAIKRILIQSQEVYKMAMQEIRIMTKLPEHPNIVKLFDFGEIKIQNKMFVCLVMELCQSNLFSVLQNEILTERRILDIFKQILDGLEVLHAEQISHRDLKLENILIQGETFKLCDFGSGSNEIIDLSQLNKAQLQQQEELFSQTTTITYRPPEMIDVLTRQVVDTKVDIWQLGCILYSLCFRKSAFSEMNKIGIAQAIFEIPQSQISISTVTLIQKMLQQDPKKRPTIKDLKISLYGAIDEDEWGEFQ
ncbi:unnamed protein product [Paramecium sonneborni]|uniref:non-specific serine/threonine protein kinase n=1 Tax=Paramecium sonneborni TaxID=65129 RepID=A0A8S1NG27_9CILI|nr:unnamed protein product [Paramecium sonneborni]